MPTCCRCSNPRASNAKYCLACKAAYMRRWRKTHPLRPDQRLKMNCRCYANVYQRRGVLVPQPCEDCQSEKAQKHHPDYSRPLLVVWLCRPCHLARHRALDLAPKMAALDRLDLVLTSIGLPTSGQPYTPTASRRPCPIGSSKGS